MSPLSAETKQMLYGVHSNGLYFIQVQKISLNTWLSSH